MAEFTKLSEVEQIESVSSNATVLIEDGGAIKRVSKDKVGGGGKALIINCDEGVYTANMTLSEALSAYNNREICSVAYYLTEDGMNMMTNMVMFGDCSSMFGIECMAMSAMALDEAQLYWTADGISTQQPGGSEPQ